MTVPNPAESGGVFRRYLCPERHRAGWLATAAVLAGTVFLGIGIQLVRKRPAAIGAWNTPSRSLRVERLGSQLRLIWNRESPVISRADAGRLLIEDGHTKREIRLDAAHLQLGSITYAPVTEKVRFQVDFSTPGQSEVSESVIVRQTAPTPPATRPPAQIARPPAPVLQTPLPAKPKPPAPGSSHKPRPPAPEAPRSAPIHSAAPRGYEPPRPAKEVAPVLPSALRPILVRPVTVEVEVMVDAAGNVAGVRPAGPYRASEFVIETAMRAARQWKFQPARRGDHAVPGATILRFKFTPGG